MDLWRHQHILVFQRLVGAVVGATIFALVDLEVELLRQTIHEALIMVIQMAMWSFKIRESFFMM